MGSINTIWNPKDWKICFEGKSKITEGDIIYKMIIGEGEDYQYYQIIEFISKNNYDNLLKGNYSINCFPYSSLPVLLFNDKQELIPLVIGNKINYDKLSENQKESINNFENKKNLFKKKSKVYRNN